MHAAAAALLPICQFHGQRASQLSWAGRSPWAFPPALRSVSGSLSFCDSSSITYRPNGPQHITCSQSSSAKANGRDLLSEVFTPGIATSKQGTKLTASPAWIEKNYLPWILYLLPAKTNIICIKNSNVWWKICCFYNKITILLLFYCIFEVKDWFSLFGFCCRIGWKEFVSTWSYTTIK